MYSAACCDGECEKCEGRVTVRIYQSHKPQFEGPEEETEECSCSCHQEKTE